MNYKRKAFASKKFLYLAQYIIKTMFFRMARLSGVPLTNHKVSWLYAASEVSEYLLQQEDQDPEEVLP